MDENKKPKLDETKLTPEQRDKLEIWQNSHDQLQVLQDTADMVQEMVGILDDKTKQGDGFGSLLMDIRDKLGTLNAKESPETPDYAKPVVEAVAKLEKALGLAISGIKLNPQIKVNAPQVNVDTPSVSVDLKGVERVLKTDLPKAFSQAIKLIPKTEIPENDYSSLLDELKGMSEILSSIDTATRRKSSPGSMAINNTSANPIPVDVVSGGGSSSGVIVDGVDEDIKATVIESTDDPGIFGLVALASDGANISGGSGGGGLTDTELRATPVPVSVSGVSTEAKQDTIIGHVDGIETLIGTTNSTLSTIDGRVDGLETLVGTTNSTLSTIDGRVDGIEGLLGVTNTNTGGTATSVASIDTKTPALGQALAAASVPIVLTAAQLSTLTPLASVTTSVTDIAPATQNITVVDSASSVATGANNQSVIIGTPTVGSAASFALSSIETVRVMVTGIWTGTIAAEQSLDGGTTWTTIGLHQGAYTTSSFTAGFVGGGNVAGATNFRMRATATVTGTAVVKVIESLNTQSVYIANAAPAGNVISVLNSTTSVLGGGAVYTGTGEDVSNFSEIRVSVIASHASATDGLSIQQSSNNTNWDITDPYTIPATTGKTFCVPRQARYFRVVYTNGATLQTSFRLQSILNRTATSSSSQRAQDAYSNENDLEQVWAFNSLFNGTTHDLMRGDITNGLDVDVTRLPALAAGSAVIGKVSIDQTTPGTTNLVSLSAETTKVIGTVNQGTSPWVTSNTTTSVVGNGAAATAQRVTIANDSTGAVRQAGASSPTLSNVSASASSVTALASNAARRYAIFYNDSTADCRLKYGTTASATDFTYYLPSLGTLSVEGAEYSGRIDVIHASATGTLRVTETVT